VEPCRRSCRGPERYVLSHVVEGGRCVGHDDGIRTLGDGCDLVVCAVAHGFTALSYYTLAVPRSGGHEEDLAQVVAKREVGQSPAGADGVGKPAEPGGAVHHDAVLRSSIRLALQLGTARGKGCLECGDPDALAFLTRCIVEEQWVDCVTRTLIF